MKAMILAAGEGTRLRPLTNDIPKCMAPVCGKPLLEWNITWLAGHGFDQLVINLFSLPQVIRGYFGDGKAWGVEITYSEEREQLGTAGGLKRAQDYFDEPFLVLYGDNLSSCNLGRMRAFHAAKDGIGTMGLIYRADATASGIVGLDEHQHVTRFLEKPKPEQVFSHWVNAGIYFLEPAIFDFIPEGKSDFGKDIFPQVLRQGKALYGYRFAEQEKLWWIDTPADLEYAQKHFNAGGKDW